MGAYGSREHAKPFIFSNKANNKKVLGIAIAYYCLLLPIGSYLHWIPFQSLLRICAGLWCLVHPHVQSCSIRKFDLSSLSVGGHTTTWSPPVTLP